MWSLSSLLQREAFVDVALDIYPRYFFEEFYDIALESCDITRLSLCFWFISLLTLQIVDDASYIYNTQSNVCMTGISGTSGRYESAGKQPEVVLLRRPILPATRGR